MKNMRPEVKRWFKIVFCTLLVVFSVSIGFSDWVLPDSGQDVTSGKSEPDKTDDVPCCYILSDLSKTYSKFEDAINVANLSSNNEVVVPILSLKEATISSDVVINSNVTLNVPYGVNDEKVPLTNDKKASTISASFSNKSNQKYLLHVADGVTITNYGTIEIGGVLGASGGGLDASGQTCGDYSSIELGNKSSILNHNMIYCYGLITEKTVNNHSSIICQESGRIEEPFIIRDFKGGSATYAAYKGSDQKLSPFNLFELRNIFPTIIFRSGSQLKGWANFYVNSSYQSMTFNVIGGSSPVIDLLSESYLLSKYVSSTGLYNTDGYCKLDFYGSISINSLSFSFKLIFTVNVSTAKGFFPISYLYQIEFHSIENKSCIVTTGNQGFKILPGASIIIDKGVTLVSSEVIIYPEGKVNQVITDTYQKTSQPIFKVNGTLAASSIGGRIDVDEEGAVLSRTNTDNVKAYEMTKISGKTIFASVSGTQDFSQQLEIRLIKNNIVSDNFELVTGKKYLSRSISSKSGYDEYTETFPITIKYIAGLNAKDATIEKTASLYDVYGVLQESDLSSFLNSGYMVDYFNAYTDATKLSPLTINKGNGVFLSEYVFSDIKETAVVYIKVNCVKYREITIKYQTEWGNHKKQFTPRYAENTIDKFYKLLTVEDELGFDYYQFGDIRSYQFENYELYPGVTTRTGSPTMTIEEEGVVVDLGTDELISAWNNKCLFVYINRKRK